MTHNDTQSPYKLLSVMNFGHSLKSYYEMEDSKNNFDPEYFHLYQTLLWSRLLEDLVDYNFFNLLQGKSWNIYNIKREITNRRTIFFIRRIQKCGAPHAPLPPLFLPRPGQLSFQRNFFFFFPSSKIVFFVFVFLLLLLIFLTFLLFLKFFHR